MLKENQKASSSQDVMKAVAHFISEVQFEYELKELPNEMQEIGNLLLETPQANDLHVREKMLRCQKFIKDFSKLMDPFSTHEVETALKQNGYV